MSMAGESAAAKPVADHRDKSDEPMVPARLLITNVLRFIGIPV